ncbi:hypothetical protein WMO64_09940 [Pseudoflavonifractor sp. CLA-AP-H29]|uniref:Uncharacterized protein n=1 Tax=Pseudoflavonifractor intestinihominis TaxID=3133171 RepID=A0ABV1ECQ7_9FIRM
MALLAVLLTAWSRDDQVPAHPPGQSRPGSRSAPPWSYPAIAQHQPRGPQPGPLVGRLAALLTARSRDQMPAHPRGQSRPESRSAPPWSCPASAKHPARGPQPGPLVARLAVLLTAWSRDQVPTRSARAAPGRRSAPRRSCPAPARHPARGSLVTHCRPVWPFC